MALYKSIIIIITTTAILHCKGSKKVNPALQLTSLTFCFKLNNDFAFYHTPMK